MSRALKVREPDQSEGQALQTGAEAKVGSRNEPWGILFVPFLDLRQAKWFIGIHTSADCACPRGLTVNRRYECFWHGPWSTVSQSSSHGYSCAGSSPQQRWSTFAPSIAVKYQVPEKQSGSNMTWSAEHVRMPTIMTLRDQKAKENYLTRSSRTAHSPCYRPLESVTNCRQHYILPVQNVLNCAS